MFEFKFANAVLVGEFSPSKINSHWLVKNNILTEEELPEEVISTPPFSHVPSETFELVVLQEKVMFTPRGTEDLESEFCARFASICNNFDVSTSKALGFNFHWEFCPESESMFAWTSKVFAMGMENFRTWSSEKQVAYGTFAVWRENEYVKRIEIKPRNLDDDGGIHAAVNMNFDLDSSSDISDQISQISSQWPTFKDESEEAVRIMIGC